MLNAMKQKLAIFDLDGTLFDTGAVNFLSYQQALSEEGYSLDREFYETRCNGAYYKDYLPLLIENPSDELMERIHGRKKIIYREKLGYALVNEHLFEIIDKIRSSYHIALVTTASTENCSDILQYFGKRDIFELVLTHADIEKVKPDPEGFFKAMAHFNISPHNTLIFEDSDTGIEAARRCGAGVLAVLNF